MVEIYKAIALGTAEFPTEDPLELVTVSHSRHHCRGCLSSRCVFHMVRDLVL